MGLIKCLGSMYHPDPQLCRVICVLKNASPMNQLSEASFAALGRGRSAASVKWIGARDSEPCSSWRAALGRRPLRRLCLVLEQSCPLPHSTPGETFNLFFCFCSGSRLRKVVNMWARLAMRQASLQAGWAAVAHSHSSVGTKACHCDGTGELSDKEMGFLSLSMP